MNKTIEKYAKPADYEQAHAYFTETKNEKALINPHAYGNLLATQGLTVNIYDCKQWLDALGTIDGAKGFKLK